MQFDSKTNFKKDLINYLDSYRDPTIREWGEIVKKHDMTNAKYSYVNLVRRVSFYYFFFP